MYAELSKKTLNIGQKGKGKANATLFVPLYRITSK